MTNFLHRLIAAVWTLLVTGAIIYLLSSILLEPPPIRCIEAQLSTSARVHYVPGPHLVPVDPLYI